MERVKRWLAGLRPRREEIQWIMGDDAQTPAPDPPVVEERGEPILPKIRVWWLSARRRVLRITAGILVVVDLGVGVLLISNVWYFNLLLAAYVVPNFLILVHYLRLTRESHE